MVKYKFNRFRAMQDGSRGRRAGHRSVQFTRGAMSLRPTGRKPKRPPTRPSYEAAFVKSPSWYALMAAPWPQEVDESSAPFASPDGRWLVLRRRVPSVETSDDLLSVSAFSFQWPVHLLLRTP
jgi:hypothetical protein